ncbi:MAG: DNA translocase FtsK [Patescibacteria group bacterium]
MDKELEKKLDSITAELSRVNGVLERINEQVYGKYYSETPEGSFDVLLDDAKKLAEEAGYVSPGLFQRKFRIGYARSASLLDLLIEKKIVEPRDGAKPCKYIMGQEE